MTGFHFKLILIHFIHLSCFSVKFLNTESLLLSDDLADFDRSHLASLSSCSDHIMNPQAIPSLVTNRIMRAHYTRMRSQCFQGSPAINGNLISVGFQYPIKTIIMHRETTIMTKQAPKHLISLRKVNRHQANAVANQQLPSIYMHNIRSITPAKFDELKLIAYKYDIITLAESWLNQSKDSLYNLEGYNIHTCNRGNK